MAPNAQTETIDPKGDSNHFKTQIQIFQVQHTRESFQQLIYLFKQYLIVLRN